MLPPFVDSLLSQGFSVFPLWGRSSDGGCLCGNAGCSSPCKHPLGALVPNGVKDATRDRAVAEAWWAQHPRANVAVAAGEASGVFILDVDGEEGQKSLEALLAEHGALPLTLEVRTGKGRHLYFRHVPGLKNSVRFAPGLDTRSDGGYVVAPGSWHANGGKYEVVVHEPPAQIPLWLIDAVREKKTKAAPPRPSSPAASGATPYGRKALDGIVSELAAVQKGGRNNAMNGASYRAGRLVAGGHVPHDEAVDRLAGACELNGLVADEGYERTRKNIERALGDGVAAGAAGPLPETERYRQETPPSNGAREDRHEGNGHAGNGKAPPLIPDVMPEQPPESEHLTDIGNGQRLVRLHGKNLRYAPGIGWLVWDERRWNPDTATVHIEHLMKRAVLDMYAEIPLLPDPVDRENFVKHAKTSEKADRIGGAIRMARSEPDVRAAIGDFDTDPFALNVLNGTINLKSGELRPHRREDLNTKIAPVAFDESARCPLWISFLERIHSGKKDVIEYLRRAVGYTLTGDTSEQAFFLLYGMGANGKSTFLNTIGALLGDGGGYYHQADFSTFLAGRGAANGGPRPDLAAMLGARLVIASESDEGVRFSEATVKSITGGDRITARRLYQNDAIEFKPTLKLWLTTNHRPNVRDASHAMWRRIHAIPHEVTIPEVEFDRRLDKKLAAELPGILNWALQGCLEWQVFGLQVPETVRGATSQYKEEQDVLAKFLAERVESVPGWETKARDLYKDYAKWAKDYGYDPWAEVTFGKKLTERGMPKVRKEYGMAYEGIKLKAEL